MAYSMIHIVNSLDATAMMPDTVGDGTGDAYIRRLATSLPLKLGTIRPDFYISN